MNLIQKLEQFHSNKSLEKRWEGENFKTNCKILKKADLKCLEDCKTKYARFILLKDLISKRAKSSFINQGLNFWLINEWGGIKGFHRSARNEQKLLRFGKEIDQGKLSRDSFCTISSLSKIASFVDPRNNVIYDSRVIYSMNWLILTTTWASDMKFFPMPPGRNWKIHEH